jgi:3-polyprenyl-4-hydroxybenzoate decarboxylase
MAWTKNLFVVDDSVDVHDLTAVLSAVNTHCKPSRDIEQVYGALDILDHAAPRLGTGMKLGFDATLKIPSEDLDGQPIKESTSHQSQINLDTDCHWAKSISGVLDATITEAAPGWLFIRTDREYNEPSNAKIGNRIFKELWTKSTSSRFIVLLGRDVNINDHHQALFHWAANTDASRDAYWDQSHGCDRVGFDATPKTPDDTRSNQPVRAWPPVLRHDDD